MKIENENIKIDKSEVLRYMGTRGKVSPAVSLMVDKYILESEKYLAARHVVREFDVIKKTNGISAGGISLEGHAIAKFLKNSDKCYLMCATAGYEIEREIDKAKALGTLEQVIIDAIGTAAVESLCDKVQNSIGGNLSRFSPGYGDLPLTIQPQIIEVLDAAKLIGVRVTNSLLLTPRKSVTAIIAKKQNEILSGCSNCGKKNCTFRNYENNEYK